MIHIYEKLKPLLTSLGANNVVKRSETDCTLVIAEFPKDTVLVSLSKGLFKNVYVAKIVLASSIGAMPWSCESLEYSPYGLYVVEGDEEELLKRIKRKVSLLLSR
ncbi:MAG TPA: hypothetical protein ENG05_03420 [Acidilobales archaeon]|nr:hypothetical protein [Acidilobales archaeon]